jgi:hypothetical protein
VVRWTCPRCDREFARTAQSHTCVPGCTVDSTFEARPVWMRAIYDVIVRHVRALGPVHEDAVTVGVFLKSDRKLAEVRPRSRDVILLLFLPRQVRDPRVGRVYGAGGLRVVHQIALRDVADVDDVVFGWLTEAFDHATERRP